LGLAAARPAGRPDGVLRTAVGSVAGAGTRGVVLWLVGPLLVTGTGMGMLTAPLTGIVLA
jgi:hypothetical protein